MGRVNKEGAQDGGWDPPPPRWTKRSSLLTCPERVLPARPGGLPGAPQGGIIPLPRFSPLFHGRLPGKWGRVDPPPPSPPPSRLGSPQAAVPKGRRKRSHPPPPRGEKVAIAPNLQRGCPQAPRPELPGRSRRPPLARPAAFRTHPRRSGSSRSWAAGWWWPPGGTSPRWGGRCSWRRQRRQRSPEPGSEDGVSSAGTERRGPGTWPDSRRARCTLGNGRERPRPSAPRRLAAGWRSRSPRGGSGRPGEGRAHGAPVVLSPPRGAAQAAWFPARRGAVKRSLQRSANAEGGVGHGAFLSLKLFLRPFGGMHPRFLVAWRRAEGRAARRERLRAEAASETRGEWQRSRRCISAVWVAERLISNSYCLVLWKGAIDLTDV